jgi:tetraacyldisaccharide 4'-kinase
MIKDKGKYSSSAPFGRSFPVRAASSVFGAAVCLRNALYDQLPSLSHKAEFPVISIGGLRAGGSGKTPTALMVGTYLLSRGRAVAFLSRGYRRKDHSLRIVKPHETASWDTAGDEPCLLHNRLPETWLGISANRHLAASRLAPLLPEHAVFVLDDGFQHRALKRNLDIVCLHDTLLTDRLIPSGFLREPTGALARAHAALCIGPRETADALQKLRAAIAESFPGLFCAVLFQEPGHWVNAGDSSTASSPPFMNPFLICGIARPERFIAMVRRAGVTPCAELVFPDHHQYTTNDLPELRELYSKGIITTEKDAVRLQALGIADSRKVWYFTVEMRFAGGTDETNFHSLIDKIVQ